MKLSGDLESRLRHAIQPPHWTLREAPADLFVRETRKDGAAEVHLTCEGARCVEWSIQDKGFGFLNDRENADGAFFVQLSQEVVEAHVVECKRTVNQATWDKAKRQMRSTLLRLHALAGVLGLTIGGVVCYTAYCESDLAPTSSPDPALKKIAIGENEPAEGEVDALAASREQFDWEKESVRLRDFGMPVSHRSLVLTLARDRDLGSDRGVGTFPLATPSAA